MTANLKVLKKISPNGKITAYLGKRDFVDHLSYVDPIGTKTVKIFESFFIFCEIKNLLNNFSITFFRWSSFYWGQLPAEQKSLWTSYLQLQVWSRGRRSNGAKLSKRLVLSILSNISSPRRRTWVDSVAGTSLFEVLMFGSISFLITRA